MQQNVAKVIPPGLQTPQGMVDTEREDTQWPVRLVGATVGERGAPEVIVEQVMQWGLR